MCATWHFFTIYFSDYFQVNFPFFFSRANEWSTFSANSMNSLKCIEHRFTVFIEMIVILVSYSSPSMLTERKMVWACLKCQCQLYTILVTNTLEKLFIIMTPFELFATFRSTILLYTAAHRSAPAPLQLHSSSSLNREAHVNYVEQDGF